MIDHYSFGNITINGKDYHGDVVILSSKKVVPNWRRGRGHRVETEDLTRFLDKTIKIVVLGKGKPGFMKAGNSLKQHLEKNGIQLIQQNSTQAAGTVNRLFKEGTPFVAGFHLTC